MNQRSSEGPPPKVTHDRVGSKDVLSMDMSNNMTNAADQGHAFGQERRTMLSQHDKTVMPQVIRESDLSPTSLHNQIDEPSDDQRNVSFSEQSNILNDSSSKRVTEKKPSLLSGLEKSDNLQKESLLIDEKDVSISHLAPPDIDEEGDLPSMSNAEAAISQRMKLKAQTELVTESQYSRDEEDRRSVAEGPITARPPHDEESKGETFISQRVSGGKNMEDASKSVQQKQSEGVARPSQGMVSQADGESISEDDEDDEESGESESESESDEEDESQMATDRGLINDGAMKIEGKEIDDGEKAKEENPSSPNNQNNDHVYLETDAGDILMTEQPMMTEGDDDRDHVGVNNIILEIPEDSKEDNSRSYVRNSEGRITKESQAFEVVLNGTNLNNSEKEDLSTCRQSGILSNFKYTSLKIHRKYLAGLAVAFMNGAIGATHAIIIGQLVAVLNPYQESTTLTMEFLLVAAYAIPLIVVMLIMSFLQSYLMHRSAVQLEFSMRSRYFKALLSQEMSYFEKQDLPRLPEKVAKQFEELTRCIGEEIGQLFFAFGAFCSGLLISIVYSPTFTTALLILLPTFLCFIKCAAACLESPYEEKVAHNQFSELMVETTRAIRLVTGTGQEERIIRKFDKLENELHTHRHSAQKTIGCIQVTKIALLLLFLIYAWTIVGLFIENQWENVQSGEAHTVTECYICIEAIIYGFTMVPLLLGLTDKISEGSICGVNLSKMIDKAEGVQQRRRLALSRSSVESSDKEERKSESTPQQKEIKNTALTPFTLSREIKVENVSFRYPSSPDKGRFTFENISFKVEIGKATGVIGSQGSGKTSLIKLLFRLYDLQEGSIHFGTDRELAKVDSESFRSQVSYVASKPQLFMGTIKQNLLMGNKYAKKAELLEALELANADFVNQLELGLDTIICSDTQGVRLTLSQQQRIAIARALLSKPQLLLIDDVMEGLDPTDRRLVQTALQKVMDGVDTEKTTIVAVMNDMSKLDRFDRLLYIKSWKQIVMPEPESEEQSRIIDDLRGSLFDIQPIESSKEAGESDVVEESESADDNSLQTPKPGKDKEQGKQPPHAPDTPWEVEPQELPRKFISHDISAGRVFGLSKNRTQIKIIFLLSLINSFWFPILALFVIRIQLLYFSFAQFSGSYASDLTLEELVIEREVYDDDKNYLFVSFAIVIVLSLSLLTLQKVMLGAMRCDTEAALRFILLKAILYKDADWFERQTSTPVMLARAITEGVKKVSERTLKRVFLTFEGVFTAIIGFSIGLYICWQQTFFVTAFSPLIITAVKSWQEMIWNKSKPGFTDLTVQEYKSTKKAQRILKDSLTNYGAITALSESNLTVVTDEYERLMQFPKMAQIFKSSAIGVHLAMAQAGRNIYMFIILLIGVNICIEYLELPPDEVLVSSFVVYITFAVVGSKMGNMPTGRDVVKSAKAIFSLIDEQPVLDVRFMNSDFAQNHIQLGKISIKDAHLKGHNTSQLVLNGLTMELPAQSRVAIIGDKESGKSYLAEILTMFKELKSGEIKIDGRRLDNYSTRRLRSQIVHLTQQPVIFKETIRENIAYGRTNASDEQIYRAAILAQALSFIQQTDTCVSDRAKDIKSGIKDIVSHYQQLCDRFKGLDTLILANESLEARQIILDSLRYADLRAYETIKDNPSVFVRFAEQELTGDLNLFSWIDLILMFEWEKELQGVIANEILSADKLNSFQRYCDSNRFRFDLKAVAYEVVQIDFSELVGHEFSIQTRIAKLACKYQAEFNQRQNQRKDELVNSLVDKKRDHEGIFRLSQGFYQDCGKAGRNLTMSQRQRISIARALIRDPKIVILEINTTAFGRRDQGIVEKAMENIMDGRTSIVITQQEARIKKCDTLFVMDAGAVVETGTYKDLSNKHNSLYNRFKRGK